MADISDVHTLRNYGKPVNCSLTMLYPAQVKILALGVGLGHEQKRTLTERETGTIHKVYNIYYNAINVLIHMTHSYVINVILRVVVFRTIEADSETINVYIILYAIIYTNIIIITYHIV